jgi:predicted transcriptional regulator
MRSLKYLEMVKEKYALNSATAVAVKLGLSKQAVSNYLNGNRVMDDETVAAVALALNLTEHQTMELVMAAGMDRAEKAGQKSLWEVFSQRMTAVAASAVMAAGVTLFLTPAPADAATMRDSSCHKANNIDYAKLCCHSKVVMSDSSNMEMPGFRLPSCYRNNASTTSR